MARSLKPQELAPLDMDEQARPLPPSPVIQTDPSLPLAFSQAWSWHCAGIYFINHDITVNYSRD